MHFASYYRWLVYDHLFGRPRGVVTILDIGCDDGGFIDHLPHSTSLALDLNLESLKQASATHKIRADGTQMPFATRSFDLVLLSDVIEHVEEDALLLRNATQHVEPGGKLWLSTTAADFRLFPSIITPRAERAWGHVRKGYTPERIMELIGPEFEQRVEIWPETAFRHMYILIWGLSKRWPGLARRLSGWCFRLDRSMRTTQLTSGHLYVEASKHQRG